MPQAASLRTSVLTRFLRYVTFDTRSREGSPTYPSTPGQRVLLEALAGELRELGLRDATCDEHGVVMATIPATTARRGVPTIGFLAHVDTSPETSGAGVRPVVHRAWRGEDIHFPDDPALVLRPAENPELAEQVGNDIVTASGLTLLGADDKSGVAVIMAATEHLLAHREIPHGVARVGFTPDEEVGRGTEHFDVGRFGARCAYTLDSGPLGRIEQETFSADAMTVTFQGFNTHPGYAKDRMVNSIRVAADFIQRLPRAGLSPETTEVREGFVHPYVLDASVDRTAVRFLIRDFVTARLREKELLLERLGRETAAAWPGVTVSFAVEESYRNMREVLERHPEVVENAREAIRRAGLPVKEAAIRGGTDGSRLSFMGLPTPNLFSGQHNIHSRLEWTSAQEMEKSVEVVVNLCRVWEERA